MAFLDETGVTNLTSDIKALADTTYPTISAIINAYSSSSAYSVGEFCIHDGSFYKCNTAIASGGETWNSSHWTQTNVVNEWGTKMVVLSYGNSTWDDFEAAYNANAIVYCKASSNSNPATGIQGRMAFMAFVGFSGSSVSNVEFQYYRSMNQHTYTNQGDQVFIYKLTKNNSGGAWTVTTREAATKIVVGTGLSYSYTNGNGVLTISLASTPSSAPLAKSTTLQASSWSEMGGDGWFTQTVSDSDVTPYSKIDLGASPYDYDTMKNSGVECLSAFATNQPGGIEFWLKASNLSSVTDYYIPYTITQCDANSSSSPVGTSIVISGGSGGGGGGNINNSAFTIGEIDFNSWDISGNFDSNTGIAEFDFAFTLNQTIFQNSQYNALYLDLNSELARALNGATLHGTDANYDFNVTLDGTIALWITPANDHYAGDRCTLHVICT